MTSATAALRALEEQLAATRLLPVVALARAEDAAPLATALRDGGVPMLEITFRTDAAARALEAAAKVAGVAVGAGTVTSKEQLVQAHAAGARFAVSPGASSELLAAAAAIGLALIPGVATASEIMAARAAGYRLVKFFPAAAMGGIAALDAFAGPFGDVRFCPSGGVNGDNFESYLALSNVIAVGGSWLAPGDAIGERDWACITALAVAARQTVDNLRKR